MHDNVTLLQWGGGYVAVLIIIGGTLVKRYRAAGSLSMFLTWLLTRALAYPFYLIMLVSIVGMVWGERGVFFPGWGPREGDPVYLWGFGKLFVLAFLTYLILGVSSRALLSGQKNRAPIDRSSSSEAQSGSLSRLDDAYMEEYARKFREQSATTQIDAKSEFPSDNGGGSFGRRK